MELSSQVGKYIKTGPVGFLDVSKCWVACSQRIKSQTCEFFGLQLYKISNFDHIYYSGDRICTWAREDPNDSMHRMCTFTAATLDSPYKILVITLGIPTDMHMVDLVTFGVK